MGEKGFDLEGYLRRIGEKKPDCPDRKALDKLMFAQQSHIPYENLSVYYGTEPIRLDAEGLYQKLVARSRGGYCFELNGIFAEALKQIGFSSYSCFCRVQKGTDRPQPMRHRGTIVEFEGEKVFCDVGYGSVLCPRSLDLKAWQKQQVREGIYWFEPVGRGWWNLHYQPGAVRDEEGNVTRAEEQVELMVCEASAEPTDFEVHNQITSNSPDSLFKRHRRAHLLTKNGSVAFMDGVLTVIEHGCMYRRKAENWEEECLILREWFGIPWKEMEKLKDGLRIKEEIS